MPSPDAVRRVSALGMFVLPVMAAKIAAVVLGGSSPRGARAADSAIAAPAGVAAAVAMTNPHVWSPQQQTAAEHIRELSRAAFGPVPLLYAPQAPEPVIEPVPEPEPVVIEPPPPPPMPSFTLRAVVATPGGYKAVINGRSCEIGEEVVAGWVVGSIDMHGRSVTIVEADGSRRVTVSVDIPQ